MATTRSYSTRVCTPNPDDVRKDPMRCVITHHIQRILPWARHVSVGTRTIRVWDYRCKHNPDGKLGACARCPGRCLVWATPLTAVRAIKDFDRGLNPTFTAFKLREDEADVVAQNQDKLRKRRASVDYRLRVASGQQIVNHRSAKAKARAMSDRRKG